MKSGFILDQFKTPTEKPTNKLVSHSQFQMWQNCPLQWKLSYIDKLRSGDQNIHSVFGDAMHTCLQEWLTIMYTETIKKSNEYDFEKRLLELLKTNYALAVEKHGSHFSSREQLSEFYVDGLAILNWIRKKRKAYFSPKHEELIGIELPLQYEVRSGVSLTGFIDIVFRDKQSGKIIIKDFKTSGTGWNQWAKKDVPKVNQIILYKLYFSKQYNIPIDDIEVEYFIVKRKVDLDSAYPQRRVQIFSPSQGKVTYKKVERIFNDFLNSCFLPDGSYNTLVKYIANAGKGKKNCRFCDFDNKWDLCPPNQRVCLINES